MLTTREPIAVPEVRGLPLIGSAAACARDFKGFLLEQWRQHGDVIRFTIGRDRFTFFADPDDVAHLLRDNPQDFTKAPMAFLEIPMRRSMLILDGELWHRRRGAFRASLNVSAAAGTASQVVDKVGAMVERWTAFADEGRELEASEEILAMQLDLTLSTLLGPAVTEADRRALHGVAKTMPWFNDRNLAMPVIPPSLPLPWNRRMRSTAAALLDVVTSAVEREDAATREGAHVLARVARAGALAPEELRDELIGLIVAGYESTYCTLSWMLHVLSSHPGWQERVADEVRSLAGDAPLEAAHLSGLTVTRRVVDEVLRLYPPFPMLVRSPARPTDVRGVAVQPGTWVMVSQWVTHRHPAHWIDPDRFDPDRFLPEAARERPAGAYFPFGEGPRLCVGRQPGLVALVLATATILRAVQVSPAPGHAPPVPTGIAIRPQGGVWIHVTRRPTSAGTARAEGSTARQPAGVPE
ncbi:MAG TPA: cytochrome P450 [Mycobacteriales bacterium]|nr:cytochrome P450 [Mycobacteriales bacterium]